MENLSHEAAPSHATPREAYEQDYYELLELTGRFTARLASNYRNEQPRTWEHVGKLEELIAMMQGMVDHSEA